MARDGQEAVEIVRGERIDLVLIDMHMPRLTGLEAIRQMKQMHQHLPCILISAEVTDELRRVTEAFRVLAKPVPLTELTDSVAAALSVRDRRGTDPGGASFEGPVPTR